MSNQDFENFPDGEWEDRGELAWNEFDWQQYLKQNDKEIARFLALYYQQQPGADHLDEVARLMGWGDQEWAPGDEPASTPSTANGATPAADSAAAAEFFDEDFDDDVDTYTIHKHPVFIATRGLYQHLYHVWERFLASGNDLSINASLAWQFAASLHAGELNSIMAIYALDLGDFTLAICHLKNALSAVNHSLSLLHRLPLASTGVPGQFFRDVQTSLFDLREIWLRVMNDCREENRRRTPGETEEQE
ncbi:MAG TPA: hypothetical protein VHC95_02210 [Opitutales bacterium]|nr:hypothetical protein [Opitutales bacterium]